MKFQLYITAFVLLLTLPMQAGADVVIDRFDVGNSGSVPRTFRPVNTYSVFTSTDSAILGGVRKWQVEVTKHSVGETTIYDIASGDSGAFEGFEVENSFDQNSITTIRWDGTDNDLLSGKFSRPLGGKHVDLTDGGTNSMFQLDTSWADVSNEFTVVVSDVHGSFEVTKTGTSTQQNEFLFSEFAGIDFTNVIWLELVISGADGADVGLNRFAAVAIPEPVSTAICGTALIIICTRRRR